MDIKKNKAIINELIEKAILARENSFSPCSNFKVGAALLTDNNTIILGANVENPSFVPTGTCAEHTVIHNAISNGYRKFKAICVCGSGDTLCYPCGICRQILMDFAPDIEIILTNTKKEYIITNLQELLPHSFNKNNLNN